MDFNWVDETGNKGADPFDDFYDNNVSMEVDAEHVSTNLYVPEVDPYGFAVGMEIRPQATPVPLPQSPPAPKSSGITGSWDVEQGAYQAGSWGDQFLQNAGDMFDGALDGSVAKARNVWDEYKSAEGVKFNPRSSMDEVFAGSAMALTSIPGVMSKLGPVGNIIKGVTPYATAAVAAGAGAHAIYKAQKDGKSHYDSMYQGGAAVTDTLTRFMGWVGSTPKRMFNAWEEDTKNLGGEGFAVPEEQRTGKQLGFDGSVSYDW